MCKIVEKSLQIAYLAHLAYFANGVSMKMKNRPQE